jgi:hypothetical protein
MAGPFGETISVDIGNPVCASCLTTWGYAKPLHAHARTTRGASVLEAPVEDRRLRWNLWS